MRPRATSAEVANTAKGLISDATHIGGNSGFYWLPPMAPQPHPAGSFQGTLHPVVRVDDTTLGTTVVTFSEGQVSANGNHYQVDWSPDGLSPSHNYRIQVLHGGQIVGFADLKVVSRSQDCQGIDPAEYVCAISSRTLPIKFWMNICGGVSCHEDACNWAGTCVPETGLCAPVPRPNGTACDDANPCTTDDACQAGACVGSTPVVCTATDQCHAAGTCDPGSGACSNPALADGTSCNDGDACTQADTCQVGACTGANPVVCLAQDQCHGAGICDSATGICSNPTSADGTSCNDGDACTQADTCQAGACTGANPVVCTAQDQCHGAGTCDSSSGTCSNPALADGTSCNDGNGCTQTDACQSGACTGANPVVCTAQDQCHAAGTCDPGSGACSNPALADGTSCNDGDACTQADTCQVGACTGANPVVCTAQDQCHGAGTCDSATGICSNPTFANGTSCNDGNACTQADTCQAGACTGASPVVCNAADQCHAAGTCDPGTGACSNPTVADGTPCSLGIACTPVNACQAGVCVVTQPNAPPSFTSTPPLTVLAGSPFNYQASAVDPDPLGPITYSLSTAPEGTTVAATTGLVAWTPGDAQVGQHLITLVANDGCATAQQTFTLTVEAQNHAPVFTSQAPLTAQEGVPYLYVVTATDPDDDPLDIRLDLAPDGMIALPLLHLLVWFPGEAQIGTHPLSLRASDGQGGIALQTTTITVSNVPDAPVFVSKPITAAQEGVPYRYAPQIWDPDLGETHVFSVSFGPPALTVTASTGVLAFTPTNAEVGTWLVELVVRDRDGLLASQRFNLAIADTNEAPVFLSSPIAQGEEGLTYLYQPQVSDPDPFDAVLFSLAEAPVGMVIDPFSGKLTWLHPLRGRWPVTIAVEDLLGLRTDQPYFLEVGSANHSPVITSTPPTTVLAATELRYAITASDPDQDDRLTFSVFRGPPGIEVDPTSGLLRFTPYGFVGNVEIGVRVVDEAGAFAEQRFTVDVTPPAGGPVTPSFAVSQGHNVTRAEDGARVVYFSSGTLANAQGAISDSPPTASGWSTASAVGQSLRVRFAGDRLAVVDRVVLEGRNSVFDVKDFEIAVTTSSSVGATSRPVFSGTMEKSSERVTFTFEPVLARQVELRLLSNHGGPRFDLPHFAVLQRPRQGGIVSMIEGGAQVLRATSNLASAPRAFDFSPDTNWIASPAGVPQTLTLQLSPAAPVSIDEIFFGALNSSAHCRRFQLKVSTSGSADADFTTAFEGEVVPFPSTALPRGGEWFQFPAVPARFVQVVCLSSHTAGTGPAIAQARIFSPNLGGPEVAFDNTTDPSRRRPLRYRWDFGDEASSTLAHPVHRYGTSGTYTIQLEVEDEAGLTSRTTRVYTALAEPSAAFHFGPLPVKEAEPTMFESEATEAAAIVAMAKFSSAGSPPSEWAIASAAFVPVSTQPIRWTEIFPQDGPVWVTHRVIDTNLIGATRTERIEVVDQPPEATAGATQDLYFGEPWRVAPSATDVNPDQNDLICTWDFGDGSEPVSMGQCAGDRGSQIVHRFPHAGDYLAKFTVEDTSGKIGESVLEVTVRKRPSSFLLTRTATAANPGRVMVEAFLLDGFDGRGQLGGQPITLVTLGGSFNGLTDGEGRVQVEVPYAALVPLEVTASFTGNSDYLACSTTQTFDSFDSAGRPVVFGTRPWSGNEGSEFLVAFPHFTMDPVGTSSTGGPVVVEEDTLLQLQLSSRVPTVATVSGPLFGTAHVPVSGSAVTKLNLPFELVDRSMLPSGIRRPGAGLRVSAPTTISVAQLQGLRKALEGALALPVPTLGTRYRSANHASFEVRLTPYNGTNSRLVLVGLQDLTQVWVSPARPVFPGGSSPFTLTLQKDELVELAGARTDVTGSLLVGDHPFAFYGSNATTELPIGTPAANMLLEYLPPASSWGQHFHLVPFAGRKSGSFVRVVADADGTEVRRNGALVTTLAAGAFIQLEAAQDAFDELVTSKPALVAQYSKGVMAEPDYVFNRSVGDPAMTLVVPEEQFATRYSVQAFDGFPALGPSGAAETYESYLSLVVPAASVSGMLVDGAPVTAPWQPIFSGAYVAAHVPIGPGTHQVQHVLPNVRFGAYVYGWSSADAYAMPAGLQLAPLYGACAPSQTTEGDGFDNDCDGRIDEELPNGSDDDGDGRIDEDLSLPSISNDHRPLAFGGHRDIERDTPSGGILLTAFDADGDPLRFDLVALPAHGSLRVYQAQQAVVAGPPIPGTSDLAGILQYVPEPGYLGPDELRFLAKDGRFTSNTGTITISVVARNRRPVISSIPQETTDELAEYRYALSATDPDPGDAVHYTKILGPEGMIVDEATGLITWTPVEADVGRHTVGLGAVDRQGSIATQSYVLEVFDVNQPPVIHSTPPSFVRVGEELVYPVLAVDPDANDYLRYVVVFGPPGLTIDQVSGVVHFRPQPSDVGQVQVAVLAGDSRGATDVQSFTLDVRPANRAPVFSSSPPTHVAPFEAYRYDAIAMDLDVPLGDTLHFVLATAPPGMAVSDAGVVTFSPGVADIGGHTVVLWVFDQAGAFAQQAWYLDVRSTNRPPEIVSLPRQRGVAGQSFEDLVQATDPDGNDVPVLSLAEGPFGMTLSSAGVLSWAPTRQDVGTRQVVIVATDREGATDRLGYTVEVTTDNTRPVITSTAILSAVQSETYRYQLAVQDPDPLERPAFSLPVAPSGMTVSRAGLIAWTPSPTQVAAHTVRVRATDFGGLFSEQSFIVTVANVNDPPELTSTPVESATQGVEYRYTAATSDPDPGDTARFLLDQGPSGMVVDPGTGLVRWTPSARQVGDNLVVLRALDPHGASSTQRFTVTVANVNDPPVIVSKAPATLVQGETFNYQVRATDPDPGDVLTYSLAVTLPGMTIDTAGLVTWRPALTDVGARTFQVRVTDAAHAIATQEETVTVVRDQVRPRVSVHFEPEVVNPGQTAQVVVTATDNARVATLSLEVNGTPLALDASGLATFTPPASGAYDALAVATDPAGNEGRGTARLGTRDPADQTAPVVRLASPVEDEQVFMPITVSGTISEAHPLRYSLLLRSEGEGPWTTLVTGTTPGPNGELGTVDPTLLENGVYILRLEVIDISGNEAVTEVPIDVQGQAKIGIFRLSFVDLQVPVVGIPITVTRTYDSRVKAKRDFGVGWSLEVNSGKFESNRTPGVDWSIHESFPPPGLPCSVAAELRNHLTTIRLSDREWYSFAPTLVNLAQGLGACYADVHYQQVDGWSVGATLDILGNTSVLQLPDSTELTDELTGQPFDPQVVLLTTPDGRMVTLEQGKGITKVEDPKGNALTLGWTGLAHNSGTSVTFTRDAQGRITQITDPLGGTLEYAYSAAGDLVSFRDQTGNETRFTYDDRHNLVDIIDPLGVRATRQEYDESGRLVATIDPLGNRYTFDHDLAARRESVTNRLGYTIFYDYDTAGNVVKETYPGNPTVTKTRTFDAHHNVLSETNENGETTTWTYDARGNKLSETNPLGETSTWTYSSFNKVTSWTDPLGSVVTTGYDAKGNQISETDQEGFTTRITVDEHGNPTWECDPRGYCRTMRYDIAGRLTKSTDKRRVPTVFTYDDAGRVLTETATRSVDGLVESLVTRYTYDAVGRAVATEHADGAIERTEYDARGLATARIDALGRRTETIYDASGRVTETRHADGTSSQTGYDAEGRAVSRTDRLGRTHTMGFDDRGRLVSDTFDGASTRFGYDPAGRRTSVTNRRGFATTTIFDAAGRMLEHRDALNHSTHRNYDAAGRLTSTTDAKGRTTNLDYDHRGLLVATHLPDGTTTRSEFDAAGNAVARIDQENRRTSYTFDAEGNLRSVTNPNNETWHYGYDEQSNLVAQTDPLGHTTRFGFDKRGRETSKQYAIGAPQQREYDAESNLVRRINHSGAVTSYQYDLNNRLVSRLQPEGPVSMTWSPTGRRLTATDARGISVKTYDAFDRLSSETDPTGNSLSYQRDAEGNVTAMTTAVGASSWTETHGFDAKNREVSVTADGQTFQLAYDGADQLTEVRYPNGLVTSYGRDALDRLTSILTRNAQGTVVMGFEYARLPAGNIVTQTEADGRIREYSYDLVDRLTEAVVRTATAVLFAEAFDYDSAGNRLVRLYSEDGGTSETAMSSYDPRDRLFAAGADVLTWDEDGRLLSRSGADGYSLTWDSEDRMLELTRADGSRLDNAYDVDGVRVRSEEISTSGSDAVDLVVSTERRLSHVAAEAEDGSGRVRARYIRAADQLLGVFRGSDHRFYHGDHIGSVRALSDAAGSVSDTYDYLAFGGLGRHAGSDTSPYLFAGEAFEARRHASQNRDRWLDTTAGRFLSIDRFDAPSGDISAHNRYAYGASNPVNSIDPTGFITSSHGYYAEEAIGSVYEHDHPGAIVTYGKWSRLEGRGYRLKPDVLNFTDRVWAEVKPLSASGIAKAGAQYLAYLAAFGPLGYSPDISWMPSSHEANIPGLGKIVFVNAGGIVFYTDVMDNVEDFLAIASIEAGRAFLRSNFLRSRMGFGLAVRLSGMALTGKSLDTARLQSAVGIAGLLAFAGVF